MRPPTNDQIAAMASEVIDSEALWATFGTCIALTLQGEGFTAVEDYQAVEDEVKRCLARQWLTELGEA